MLSDRFSGIEATFTDYNSVIAIVSIVMNNAKIGNNCIIGSNSLVRENQVIPDGSLVIGTPGEIKKKLSDKEIEKLKWYASHYIEKIKRFKNGLKIIDNG